MLWYSLPNICKCTTTSICVHNDSFVHVDKKTMLQSENNICTSFLFLDGRLHYKGECLFLRLQQKKAWIWVWILRATFFKYQMCLEKRCRKPTWKNGKKKWEWCRKGEKLEEKDGQAGRRTDKRECHKESGGEWWTQQCEREESGEGMRSSSVHAPLPLQRGLIPGGAQDFKPLPCFIFPWLLQPDQCC